MGPRSHTKTQFLEAHGGVSVGSDSQFPVPINHDLAHFQSSYLTYDQAPFAANDDHFHHTLSGFFDTLSKTGSLSKANKNLFLKTLKLTKKGIKKGAALLKAALFKGKLLAKAKTKLAKFGAKFKKDEEDKESEIKTQALPTVALHFVPSQPVQILPVEHFVEKQVAPAPPVLKDPPLVYGPPPQTPRYTYGPPEDTKPLYVQQSSNKKDISGPVSTITGTLPSSAQTSVFSWLNPFSWFSGSPFDTDEEIYDYDHVDVHDRRFKRSVEHSHVESSSSHVDKKDSAAEEFITHQQEVYRSRLAEGPMADADGEPIFGVFGGGPVDGFIPDGPPPPYGSNHWAHHAGPVDSVATEKWDDAEEGNETNADGLTPTEDRIYNLV
ncbi:uncharacterized protein LOC108673871 [Hyalella azteca]|uniref:Uncharacterized protein LOC108673871 n=1 Tax=Hyalella azteca TaxID=294128 RepID=A0A8B7NWF6_HYAAZ|nr:uncharacterized protein LOC108673871 [Hyalella azteca]